ncbi:zinc knuckle CX2CX4HX4C containing protein [Tanacetum coccineum]
MITILDLVESDATVFLWGVATDQFTVLLGSLVLIEDIKRGPYSKKSPIRRIQDFGYAFSCASVIRVLGMEKRDKLNKREGYTAGEELFRSVATRMNRMTGMGDTSVSQPRVHAHSHKATDVVNLSNPSSYGTKSGPVKGSSNSAVTEGLHEGDGFNVLQMAGSFSKVWSELTSEKRSDVMDTLCDLWNAIVVEIKKTSSSGIPHSAEADITKSTSYAGATGASTKEQPKVNSNFRPLMVDPVFNGVNISIPRKVIEKVSTRFEHTLYGYFIRKRMAFSVVEYYARNNWGKHGLKRIMMNNKGFFFFKFESKIGLEYVLEGGHWMIRNSPIILKKWLMGTSLLKEELTRIPIWRPPRCDECKIFGHVHDHCPKKVVNPPIVSTSNVVAPTIEKSNDGFQTPKETPSAPKKGATNMRNPSKSSSMLKNVDTSPKKDNFTTSNSFSALNDEEEDDEEEEVENSKLSRFGRSDCDGVLEDRLVGPSMVGFVMEKKDGSNMREDITTRVNLEESGATCDGSPKVSNSSPLVSPTATINMPQGLYNVDVAATFGVPLTIVGDLHILIKCIEAEADIVDVITIGIPSLTGDGFTKETIHVVYEWRPHRCDICKIFGHVHDHCPNKAVSPPIVNTSNVVTPIVEKTNRRKGKATINALKKGATNVGNPSTSSSMLKTTGISSKKYNIPTCNSYFVLNDEQEEEEEDVENMYDETANLFTKTGESSSFTAVVG